MKKQWLNEEALDVFSEYYYPRAKWLQQNCNWGKLSYLGSEATSAVNDPLMQSIDIYDCYTRDAAGFSNVIQDLRLMTNTPKWHHQDDNRRRLIESYDTHNWDTKTWFFVYLCHRMTGSGASFTRDHGYRNNAVQYWGSLRDIKDMKDHMIYLKSLGKPLFTSIGNQPPSPRKGITCLDFMIDELEILIDGLLEWLPADGRKAKGVIHWVSASEGVEAEIRDYDRLFTVPNPAAEEDFTTVLNPESLVIRKGYIEPSLLTADAQQGYQFERLGYYCFDGKTNAEGKMIFNKTVGLRDSWGNGEK